MDRLILTLWTDDPELAARADTAGVDRIGPDLERIGKQVRQPSGGYWLSSHHEACLPALAGTLRTAALFARTNPPHGGWRNEVARLLASGVRVLMLPAFHAADDVRRALDIIDGRATLVPLIETAAALEATASIARIEGLSEVHFGLNDLGLALRASHRFCVTLDPRLQAACDALRDAGIAFGIGGIGRAADTHLPVPADLLYARYAALGATRALIARSFLAGLAGDDALRAEVVRARTRFAHWQRADACSLRAATDALHRAIPA